MKNRIAVAMSGGVDSSVAAALLKRKGFEVIGITMSFPDYCSSRGIDDARKVARKLNIEHFVFNLQESLDKHVIDGFCEEYLKGRTPNPCIICNQYIKFGVLLKKALGLGAECLGTGHYARTAFSFQHSALSKRYLLKKARDKLKDQSYFLYRLSQSQLKRIIFPLGNYSKLQVREIAKQCSLPVADKSDSQEICFLPDQDYRVFLKTREADKIKPGLIVDIEGNILGQHKGLAFYTIGQREGLGVARGYPVYITQLGNKNNRIVVGKKEDVFKREFLVKKAHFISKPIKKKVVLRVRIRYNHKEALAKIEPHKDKLKVKFNHPQFAITPGQSAVFYSGDTVLGGGIIDRILE